MQLAPLHSQGPISAAASVRREGGELRVTVVVKATFRLVHDGWAAPERPLPLSESETSAEDGPATDVTLAGHAHAPSGLTAPSVVVRLALFRSAAVFDKTVAVTGDRASPDAPPQPFTSKLVRSSWEAEQRLHGDEWLVLDGVHPSLPRLQTKLPGAGVVARAYQRAEDGSIDVEEVPLVIRALAVDADLEVCSITWRGSVAVVGGEPALPHVRVAAALSVPGTPIKWPVAAQLYAAPSPHVRTGPALPIVHATPFHVVTTPWQLRPGRDVLVVIVKGTFELVQGGPAAARALADADLPTGDLHVDDDPEKSLSYASDFAILKAQADVTLLGTARSERPTQAMRVTFEIGRPGRGFQRTIAVIGNRRYQRELLGLVAGPPELFTEMPLGHERAFGGPGFAKNPVGIGVVAEQGSPLPNLEDPSRLIRSPNDRPAPASFGPVAPTWEGRRDKLGTYDRAWLQTRWPYYPEDFDPAYHQAAPAPQRLPFLDGDEPYAIEGVSADGQRLSGALPGLRVRCVAERTAAAGAGLADVPLRLDTAAFDADARKLTLVWRGALEVADDEATDLQALFVHEAKLSAPALSSAAVRAECIARAARPEEPAAPPAPAAPQAPSDGRAEEGEPRWQREMAQVHKKLEETLGKAGIDINRPPFPPLPGTPTTPEGVLADGLRRARFPEKDIEALVASISSKTGSRGKSEQGSSESDWDPPGPRAQVKAKLAAGDPLDGMDLSGADLSGLDFARCSMRRARLEKAVLRGARLEGVDLTGASLRGADLRDADLDSACLNGADVSGADLRGAELRHTALDFTDFQGADGRHADFGEARGEKADFADGKWEDAVFDGADLGGADFSRATLSRASFLRARLASVRLFDARADGARFDDADLRGARADAVALPGASLHRVSAEQSVWEGADLSGASFFGARMRGAGLSRVRARGAVFSGADLQEAAFRRSVLSRAQLLKTNLFRATFERADLRDADLRGANLHGAELLWAQTSGAQTDLALLSNTKLARKT